MPGGLLNLISYGNQNVILNGNPSKTFFTCTYAKYTNFGMQKFRVDYNGLRTLRMAEPSVFTFKMPKNADLLMDTHLVVNLPTIWSPIKKVKTDASGSKSEWRPYEFKWIKNLGSQMIKRVTFTIGGLKIQEFTGQYLYNLVERDFDIAKKNIYYEMTGNVPELNDPANAFGRTNSYPNAIVFPDSSLNEENIYIDANAKITLTELDGSPINKVDKITAKNYKNNTIETFLLDNTSLNENNSTFDGSIWDKCFTVDNIENTPTTIIIHYSNWGGGETSSGVIHTEEKSYDISKSPVTIVDTNITLTLTKRDKPCENNTNQFTQYNTLGPEPSIRNRKIYVPLNIWFTLASKMALPLVAMKYHELQIELEIRPVQELFVVKNITDDISNNKYIKPDFNSDDYQLWRFLQPPPYTNDGSGGVLTEDKKELSSSLYVDKRVDWDADVHLLSTYVFLTDEEARVMTNRTHKYLIKDIYEYNFYNITETKKVNLHASSGMVSSWMWYFQRTDIGKRNEWSNYTNWEYDYLPHNVKKPDILINSIYTDISNNPNFFYSGEFQPENEKNIMRNWALLFDGKYRENTQDYGVLSYIEKICHSNGSSPEGLYNYNFCINTSPFDLQPSGAINLSKFNKIEFEMTTITPPYDDKAKVYNICNGEGDIIGVNKAIWDIFQYNYDLTVIEERYNVLTFHAGSAELMFTR